VAMFNEMDYNSSRIYMTDLQILGKESILRTLIVLVETVSLRGALGLGLSTLCFLIYLLFFLAILFLFAYYSQNYSQILPKLIPKIVKIK